MAHSAVMAGADGVILETHPKPEEALSDGKQSLHFKEASKLYQRLQQVLALREEKEEVPGVEGTVNREQEGVRIKEGLCPSRVLKITADSRYKR
jgi:hypothetical protein